MKQLTLLLLFLLLAGCFPDYNVIKVWLPAEPVNLADVNTPYDDMNSAGPPYHSDNFTVLISSNRSLGGDNFNIHWFNLHLGIYYETGTYDLWVNEQGQCRSSDEKETINSASDEFGPFVHSPYHFGEYDPETYDYSKSILFYSSDRDTVHKQDLFVTDPTSYEQLTWRDSSDGIIPVQKTSVLNSDADDYYATIGPDKTLYFCSNRDGEYSIYAYDITADTRDIEGLIAEVTDPENRKKPYKVDILSSSADDKCPYIDDSLMLFVSNREGGFGKFDIWKSEYDNGVWSAPVNLGDTINSSSDEYRPIRYQSYGTQNALLIFSSNRAGGYGGYDIYYAGIEKDSSSLLLY